MPGAGVVHHIRSRLSHCKKIGRTRDMQRLLR
jgi:hypothetical protein